MMIAVSIMQLSIFAITNSPCTPQEICTEKSMLGKFLQDIYLEYFVIFGTSWIYFGTDTTQPSQSCMTLVIFVRYACKCQKMAAIRIEFLLCNHSINAVLTGFNSTGQRIQVKFKAKIINL